MNGVEESSITLEELRNKYHGILLEALKKGDIDLEKTASILGKLTSAASTTGGCGCYSCRFE